MTTPLLLFPTQTRDTVTDPNGRDDLASFPTASIHANDADFALARRLIQRVRGEIRRAGVPLWTLRGGETDEQWLGGHALVGVATNSELYARFTNTELAGWRRPVWRVRCAGVAADTSGRPLTVGVRLRHVDTLRGDFTLVEGAVLGTVRHIETRTVGGSGLVVSTTAWVAAAA